MGGILLIVLLSPLLLCVAVEVRGEGEGRGEGDRHDYCVVGAGPAGLQMAYFLKRAGRNYVVYERNNISGSFFEKFPRHGGLISINKRHTGKSNKEFNLRHDWNSLLSDDDTLLMKHYSKVLFPSNKELVKYLGDYTERLGLNVMFNTEVSGIERLVEGDSGQHFTMSDQRGHTHSCNIVIMANGAHVPSVPKFRGSELTEGYESLSTNPEDYEGQSVLILGRGNSAFEVAHSIYGNTNYVHLISRSRVRLSFSTHYVGDTRAINNGVLDTYQLKSLDGLLEGPVESIMLIRDHRGKIRIATSLGVENSSNMTDSAILRDYDENVFDNDALREGYDKVLRCLGFLWDDSLLTNSTNPGRNTGRKKSKFPNISPTYEAVNVSGLYFAGANTHSLDHRKSAGGFIHGFRYTTRTLHRYLEVTRHGQAWPHTSLPITDLVNHILKRMNEASGLYQMFSVLADVVVFSSDKLSVRYYEEFPVQLIDKFSNITGDQGSDGGVLVCVLEYGKGFSKPGADTFRSNRATLDPLEAHTSNFLHPVLYFYHQLPSSLSLQNEVYGEDILPRPDHLHHIVEDFLTTWDCADSHHLPLRWFVEQCVGGVDLRAYSSEECWAMSLLAPSPHLPPHCLLHYEMSGEHSLITTTLTDSMRRAVSNEKILFISS